MGNWWDDYEIKRVSVNDVGGEDVYKLAEAGYLVELVHDDGSVAVFAGTVWNRDGKMTGTFISGGPVSSWKGEDDDDDE